MKVDLNLFIESLRAPTGAPGGGAASAVSASLGCALYQMVAGVTLSLPRFTEGRDRLAEIEEEAIHLCDLFQTLSVKDAQAYSAVEAAMKMPRSTSCEKAARRNAMQDAFRNATVVPLEIVESVVSALTLLRDLLKYGNPNAITDVAVGTLLLEAARKGASMNAEINLGSIRNQEFVKECGEKLSTFATAAESLLLTMKEAAKAAGVTF